MMLTLKQRHVLQFIEDYLRCHQRSPTFREIGQGMGVRSTNTVAHYIRVLEEKGAIARVPGEPRTIELICLDLAEPGPTSREEG
jgi:repressor LexA